MHHNSFGRTESNKKRLALKSFFNRYIRKVRSVVLQTELINPYFVINKSTGSSCKRVKASGRYYTLKRWGCQNYYVFRRYINKPKLKGSMIIEGKHKYVII